MEGMRAWMSLGKGRFLCRGYVGCLFLPHPYNWVLPAHDKQRLTPQEEEDKWKDRERRRNSS